MKCKNDEGIESKKLNIIKGFRVKKMGKHGVLLRIFKQYHIEWIWYLSKEMRYLIFFAAGIFALDQLFKHAIDEEPKENFPRDLPGSKGLVQIRRAHNPGFSMGRLEKYPKLVKTLSLIATLFLIFALPYMSILLGDGFFLQKWGTAMVIGGASSNTYDRLIKGKVTDYINVRVPFLKNAIINIGDIAIYFGGMLYGIGVIFDLLKNK